ncbi:Uncharacterised protein [Mycobacterium tuberculosis]|nr:Uncharacterised protein [Mycobacterium tuberculosis]
MRAGTALCGKVWVCALPQPIGSVVTKYDQSYVHYTDLHTVAKTRLRRRPGLLPPGRCAVWNKLIV